LAERLVVASGNIESVIQRAYEAFNARDLDTALATMDPEVDWPNAIEGGRVHGHQAVREYWTAQFKSIDPTVVPVSFSRLPDGRVAVTVHQVVKNLGGSVLSEGDVQHVYTLRDGLVSRMEIAELET
jgi:hypothetical protein